MKVFRSLPKLVRYGLLFYFLIPYFVFLKYFNIDFNLDYSEIFWAFKNSLSQAAAAAALVTFLSVPMSLGLFFLKPKLKSFAVSLLLIPQILPSLFTILIAFSLWNPFPMGSVGITFIFTIVHLGFVTVFINASTEEKLSSYSINSEIFGISRWKFFLNIYFPLMRSELVTGFILIFIYCFTSFSIPLVAGGGRGTNLELLIYETIFIKQNWSAAWMLNIFQSFFIFALSLSLLRHKSFVSSQFNAGPYLKSKVGLALIVIYLATYLGGYAIGLANSLGQLDLIQSFSTEISNATIRSLQILTIYLCVCSLLLILSIFDFIKNGKHGNARHFLSTSTILVGFSFYLLFPAAPSADFFKLTLAMSILFFPALFKSFLEKPLDQLHRQIQVAQIYGISTYRIITTVVLQQMKRPLFLWVSFLVIWFLSDFAVVKSLGIQRHTLGMMTENFLGSYRLSLAYLLSFYILVLWLLIMLVIYVLSGVYRVVHKKSSS